MAKTIFILDFMLTEDSPSFAICVTFYYRENRIPYLLRCLESLSGLPGYKEIFVVTNASSDYFDFLPFEHYKDACSKVNVSTFPSIGHPLLFPWCHFELWKTIDLSRFTHYMYLEDDIRFTAENFYYWVSARSRLAHRRLIPGFLRVERNSEGVLFATDVCSPMWLPLLPSLRLSDGSRFVSSVYPYQGMYLFDKLLMEEFLNSGLTSPNSGLWRIQEKAAQGLTYLARPFPFFTRIVHPFSGSSFNTSCFIEHMAANYVSNSGSPFAKIPVSRLFAIIPRLSFLFRLASVILVDSYVLARRQ